MIVPPNSAQFLPGERPAGGLRMSWLRWRIVRFEAWFLASAESLAGTRGLPVDLSAPIDPEAIRGAKDWLSVRMGPSRSYSPTLDQPAFAGAFSIEAARMKSPSFDRCCRKLEQSLRRSCEQPSPL